MRSLILCEGHDEVYILGYYLHKTSGWVYFENEELSEDYKLPRNRNRNQIIEVYKKDRDRVAIWGVGGKDNFAKSFKFLEMANNLNPESGIEQVFILLDRDHLEIEKCLETIKNKLRNCGLSIDNLKNNQSNVITYEIEDETYGLNVIPMIIPFDEEGALETVLLSAIEKEDEEGEFVAEIADEYINNFLHSSKKNKYLKKERLVTKAKFSAAISITNPDRSTAEFNTLLMSHPWEEKEAVQRHFKILNEQLEK